MKRDDIMPRTGDVWENKQGDRRCVIEGAPRILWTGERIDSPWRRCSLSTFRDWVGAKGRLVSRNDQQPADAGE